MVAMRDARIRVAGRSLHHQRGLAAWRIFSRSKQRCEQPASFRAAVSRKWRSSTVALRFRRQLASASSIFSRHVPWLRHGRWWSPRCGSGRASRRSVFQRASSTSNPVGRDRPAARSETPPRAARHAPPSTCQPLDISPSKRGSRVVVLSSAWRQLWPWLLV